jgi:hypothetical protein
MLNFNDDLGGNKINYSESVNSDYEYSAQELNAIIYRTITLSNLLPNIIVIATLATDGTDDNLGGTVLLSNYTIPSNSYIRLTKAGTGLYKLQIPKKLLNPDNELESITIAKTNNFANSGTPSGFYTTEITSDSLFHYITTKTVNNANSAQDLILGSKLIFQIWI